ncbi:cell envelope integrity protein CreD [Vibrio sp. B513a]|jgi:inner membrane protein|uniref:cell envelope integrity protein CreD n=1 Tax=Vibrio TaxID=662 RepID=UPI00046FC73A|nr:MULTISPECIES: cell envelope integrity protein CreD [Vibrio]AVF63008.1 cell envelope integrity protein CreD [Vibrio alginolyticus]EGQ9769012.1 cell envelope integrity protein CreD [Vibrio alginolyticus]EHA1077181.1 cell envelope integrity protein CreD [Vibrio alginolyticus]EHA1135120.1 cell envelope integrity protein CreD [Vibrio alginolyticus]EHA1203554.1 cell envelope integrity protein CreD [Vibrio alginolyticus]
MKKILNNQLGTKFAFVLFLFVLLQIPLSMVTGLISERSYRQDEVRNDIARSSSGEQRIIGPFIMVNYTETSYRDDKVQIKERRKFLLPSTFDMSANLDSFEKYRGIYRARLYKAQVALKGTFDADDLTALQGLDIDNMSLVVGIEDSRGLIRLDDMTMASSDIEVAPGTGLNQLPQGFHSDLTLADLNPAQPLAFDLNFLLQGMGQLQVTPIGSQTTVELSSTWAHPSFIGDYLPVSSEVSEDGFNAQWASNNFSTNIAQLFQSCLSSNHACHELEQRQMGVDLIDPVDHYLKSHRAVNYSLLVITLVFASFFLLELFQARPVHPVQYGFIGLALALFYLLLISMSEHLGFNWAYVVSAVASTGLLSVYVSGMLSNTKHGAIFGVCLLTLYGLLFGLLQAESYALVMGTLLCFAILSFTMVITRNIDWYARNKKEEESAKANHEDI